MNPTPLMTRRLTTAFILLCTVALCPAPTIQATEVNQGRAYFLRYCASCHGVNGDGLGPAAPSLKVHPPDLRRLSEVYGLPLPAAKIARFIDGSDHVSAHGSREMPVWGKRFKEIWTSQATTHVDMNDQIRQIVAYLNSVQLAGHPASVPQQGAEPTPIP